MICEMFEMFAFISSQTFSFGVENGSHWYLNYQTDNAQFYYAILDADWLKIVIKAGHRQLHGK